jgi:hypothetical protein
VPWGVGACLLNDFDARHSKPPARLNAVMPCGEFQVQGDTPLGMLPGVCAAAAHRRWDARGGVGRDGVEYLNRSIATRAHFPRQLGARRTGWVGGLGARAFAHSTQEHVVDELPQLFRSWWRTRAHPFSASPRPAPRETQKWPPYFEGGHFRGARKLSGRTAVHPPGCPTRRSR